MKMLSRTIGVFLGLGATWAVAAPGEGSDSWADAVFGGEAHLNLRVRAEFVDATGSEDAQAYTERLRAGYGSKPFNGFSFSFDFEDIRTVDDDLYNASGIHGDSAKAVVADPEATELNQGFLKYQDPDQRVTLIGGRQRITLDDHRFVGDVGWRQNEQTFDAATVIANLPGGMTGQYSYLWDINRIFGQGFVKGSATSDFKSDSHLFNLSKSCEGLGTVTGFAYLLDFDNSPANSSDTYGVRYQGSFDFTGDYSVDPVLSYASQSDNNANPASYDADYTLAQVSVVRKGTGSIGAGYEILGSDGGAMGFRTPLATGHAFNGWFDSFLVTPAAGLRDIYLFATADLPGGAVGKIFGHWFGQDVGGLDLGNEIDVLLSKKVDEHISVLAKYAYFNGDSGLGDGMKFWLQTEIKSR